MQREVIAADIAPLMRARAEGAARTSGNVCVQEVGILALPYPRRVVRRGGCRGSDDVREPTARRWRARARPTTWGSGPRDGVLLASSPTEEARHLFLGEVCPALRFDSVEEREEIYAGAGVGRRSRRGRSLRHDDTTRVPHRRRWHAVADCAGESRVLLCAEEGCGQGRRDVVPYLGSVRMMACMP